MCILLLVVHAFRGRMQLAADVEAGTVDRSEAGLRGVPMFCSGELPYVDCTSFYTPAVCHGLCYGLVDCFPTTVGMFTTQLCLASVSAIRIGHDGLCM
jgi:hypothetical protein